MQQQCRITEAPFEVTPDDEAFYKRVAVPPPTLCPEERMRRRLSFRNERTLYHRACAGSGVQMVTMYAPELPLIVYDNDFWWTDAWDARSYARDFDFTRPFFEQFHELALAVPKMARIQQGDNENSRYTNCASHNKNCYLIFSAGGNEDCQYSHWIDFCRNALDCFAVLRSEVAYECVHCTSAYDIQFCQEVHNSSRMRHSFDCRNCTNCFACAGLRGQSNMVLNQSVTNAQFETLLADPDAQSAALAQFAGLLAATPRQFTSFLNCEDFTGAYLTNCKNTHVSWDCTDLEDCKFCGNLRSAKSAYDVDYYGVTATNELLYECEGVGHGVFNVRFSKLIWGGSSDVTYSYECFACQDIFGCSGIKKTRFAVFNQQLPEKHYRELTTRIIEHMKETGEWGEFFPPSLSPFGYNETSAQMYLPLTREAAVSRGFKWRDDSRDGPPAESSAAPRTSGGAAAASPDTLVCRETGKPYRLTPQERTFYQQNKIPIPQLSPEARHQKRVRLSLPRNLHYRYCESCGTKIESVYPPTLPEIVYCTDCYLKALY